MSNLTPIRELIETLWNVNDDSNVKNVVKIRIYKKIFKFKNLINVININFLNFYY